jgi:hypothetical protein
MRIYCAMKTLPAQSVPTPLLNLWRRIAASLLSRWEVAVIFGRSAHTSSAMPSQHPSLAAASFLLISPMFVAVTLVAVSDDIEASRAPAKALEEASRTPEIEVAAAPPTTELLPPPPLHIPAPPKAAASQLPIGTPALPVRNALHQAARATDMDPALLYAMAWKESRFDPKAQNTRSTARGLMQFTDETWLEVVRDYGPRHGLAHQAAAIITDRKTGRISVRDGKSRKYVLGLRDNPRLSAALAVAWMAGESAALERVLGRPVTETDLYAVHFLGPAGAQRFLTELERSPFLPAAQFVNPDGVSRNRNIFIERNGRIRSLREVYSWMADAIQEQRDRNISQLAEADTDAKII